MAKILIVEDDEILSSAVRELLEAEHHMIDTTLSGEEALAMIDAFSYELFIFDWELPGEVSGLDLCRKLRGTRTSTPIIMLTGKTQIVEKETGLDSGADDYITKPFHPRELSARVRSVLRRPAVMLEKTLRVRGIELDTASQKVTKNGESVPLKPNEFVLLEFLMRHTDQVFSTNTLIQRCRASDADTSIDAMYTCIRRLRRKLDSKGEPSIITTVHASGYRMDSNP